MREKKSGVRFPDAIPPTPESSFPKGLESCINALLTEALEPEEFRFFQSELAQLIGGSKSSTTTDGYSSEVNIP